MASKSNKKFKIGFKKSSLKAFLFFLVFSSAIWLLIQFSQTHTEVISVPLQFENYPKDKLIEKEGDKIDIRVKQNGFRLAWFKFFKPILNVDLEELPVDSTYLNFKLRDYREELRKEIPLDFDNLKFLDKEIHIPFQMKSLKKVPITSKIKIQYAPGYSSEKTIVLKPDSVKISGPSSILDTVSEIPTKSIRKKRVKNDINETVALKNIDPKVDLYEERVKYKLEVSRFTERQLTIPITVINAPENINLSLYPPSVDITFKVSLKRYKQIQSIDFKVVADYEDILYDENYLIPSVVTQPKSVRNISIYPRKVQYVIKK